MDDLGATLRRCLRSHLPLLADQQELDMSASLRDLGLDSVTAIDLLLDLERTFEVSFPDDMIASETFGSGASLQRAIETLRGDAEKG